MNKDNDKSLKRLGVVESGDQCTGNSCGCAEPGIITRRGMLQTMSAGAAGFAAANMLPSHAMAGPFSDVTVKDHLVPADKQLSAKWLESLVARGAQETYTGEQLKYVGMPIGGIGCGQLYMGGDGRLWHWDIFKCNYSREAGHGQRIAAMTLGGHYKNPQIPGDSLTRENGAEVDQGFAIQTMQNGKTVTRFLDQRDFPTTNIHFRGEYPVAKIAYQQDDLPVDVRLTAFSPFIPLETDDSALPATVFQWEVRNTSEADVEIGLAGYLENAICPYSHSAAIGIRRTQTKTSDGMQLIFDTAPMPAVDSETREDIVLADFEADEFPTGWKAEGSAFPKGPMHKKDLHSGQPLTGNQGVGFANTYDPRAGEEDPNVLTGMLTSAAFKAERNYVSFLISGGDSKGKTEIQLFSGDRRIAAVNGQRDNTMRRKSFDIAEHQGKELTLKILDSHDGAWGIITVDDIRLTDNPVEETNLEKRHGYGTMALGVFDGESWSNAYVGDAGNIQATDLFTGGDDKSEHLFEKRPVAAIGSKVKINPGEVKTIRFILGWYFPDYNEISNGQLLSIKGFENLRRHYAPRFKSAGDVITTVAKRWDYFAGETLNWNKTYYDGTLPYWLLDRAFISLDCLATQTVHYFDSGRFWGWEGVDCCPGTCTHVWQYAQAMARVFPSLERGLRSDTDYGETFNPNGKVSSRGDFGRITAVDGQCGTILRVLREHRMTTNNDFLKALWPKVKKSFQFLEQIDSNGDGLLDRHQEHTLHAWWSGEIAWISSMYLAAAAACGEMAKVMDDQEFAAHCGKVLEKGRDAMNDQLFDGEYFFHKRDPKEPKSINTNDGCHIDQILGQSFAFQVGLHDERVITKSKSVSALNSLWKYNFAPDAGQYSIDHTDIGPAFRWYAMPGEAGLLMTTWPKGGARDAIPGRAPRPKENPEVWTGPGGYFNECMNGFEYQAASHMIYEGEPGSKLVQQGLAVFKAVHERYRPEARNPYNEIECSDHYARSMASYGVLLAVCGYSYDGPAGQIAFAPRLTPENFKAPFTIANGWGTYTQTRESGKQQHSLSLKFGTLKLSRLSFELAGGVRASTVGVNVNNRDIAANLEQNGTRIVVTLIEPAKLTAGEALNVLIQ